MEEYTKNIKYRLDGMTEKLEGMVVAMAEVRAFLRLLNSSEENVLTDEAHAKFVELCDKHIPNG
jgi:hypothetical protein